MRSAEKKLMFSRVLRKAKEERGSAAVEFAMVLPFLLVLLCGIIESLISFVAHWVWTETRALSFVSTFL